MKILELLKTRRSHFVKEFTGETIPKTEIDYLLSCANWAPSHRLTYPWHFVVFTGDTLNVLCNKMEEIYVAKTDSEKISRERIVKIHEISQKASHAIAICMKRDAEKRIPEIEEICATACAVQNMYLGLLDIENTGGYWSTGNGVFTPEMHQFLNLGQDDKLLGFFILGKLKSKRTHANRPDWNENVKWF
jgi:nitroreductase